MATNKRLTVRIFSNTLGFTLSWPITIGVNANLDRHAARGVSIIMGKMANPVKIVIRVRVAVAITIKNRIGGGEMAVRNVCRYQGNCASYCYYIGGMYFYRIAWAWYEDYVPIELCHEFAFAQEEFDALFMKCVVPAFEQLVEEERTRAQDIRLPRNFSFLYETERKLLAEIANIMIEQHGFSPLTYHAKAKFFGSLYSENEEFDSDVAKHLYENFPVKQRLDELGY